MLTIADLGLDIPAHKNVLRPWDSSDQNQRFFVGKCCYCGGPLVYEEHAGAYREAAAIIYCCSINFRKELDCYGTHIYRGLEFEVVVANAKEKGYDKIPLTEIPVSNEKIYDP